jgi:hypothetical protein
MKATHIVVVQSGWVFVGTRNPARTDVVELTDAACVRRWGTTRGLGELALSGPLKETVLDPCGRVEVPHHAVHFMIDAEQSKWR